MSNDNIGYGEGFADTSEEEEDTYKYFCLNHGCWYRTREDLKSKHGNKGCSNPRPDDDPEEIEDHRLITGWDKEKCKNKTVLYKHCNHCTPDCKIPKCPRCGERLIPYTSDDGFTGTEPRGSKQYE